jgi:aminoglycoside 6'-N-acetyltransferase
VPAPAPIATPTLTGPRVMLRPLGDDDLAPLAAVMASPEVHEWWGPLGSPEQLREDLLSGTYVFAIEAGGDLAGWLSAVEDNDENWRSAAIDIILAGPYQDRGLGTEALRLVITWLIDVRGHRRLTIDPAAANARAIRAYEAVGFRPVGIMREVELGIDGAWHDGLLMDLLAREFDRGA